MNATFATRIGSTLILGLALSPAGVLASAPAIDLAGGERLFRVHCASCHGNRGEGDRGPSLEGPQLVRGSTDGALHTIIANGIPGTEMPRFTLAPEDSARLVAWVRQLGRLPVEQVPGDPARGERLFATKGACTACHFLRGEGGAFGLDLTAIGRRRGAAYLKAALLEPQAHVPQLISAHPNNSRQIGNFLFVRVVPKSGEMIAGVRVNEDTFSIQLRDTTGRIHSFFKSELSALHKDWGWSPMPAYGAVLAQDEVVDVVAFLTSLKGEP